MLAHLLLLVLAQHAPVSRDSLPASRGVVVRVSDADTFIVRIEATTRTGEKTTKDVPIRIYGIDAPERGHAFEDEARNALTLRVKGREVELLEVGTDHFGRTLAIVLLDGHEVAEDLLRPGLAWAYRRYLGKLQGDEAYCRLEYEARAAQAGLWERSEAAVPGGSRKGGGRARVKKERSPEDCVANFERR